MAAKFTRLTHKIAIQLHLVAESCTICNSRSRQSVRKFLDTPWYHGSYFSVCFGYPKQPESGCLLSQYTFLSEATVFHTSPEIEIFTVPVSHDLESKAVSYILFAV
jgi:hypothetical protein